MEVHRPARLDDWPEDRQSAGSLLIIGEHCGVGAAFLYGILAV
ncbi:MAG: hypothetical protein WBZ33_15960 [Thermoactinomyces sp.]